MKDCAAEGGATMVRYFLLGLLVGWLVEWIIDWIWWRRRGTGSAGDVAARAPETGACPAPAREPDDLTLIEGIGPRIAGLLAESGIRTFADLAVTPVARLDEILKGAGPKFFRLADPVTWPDQALLAARGEWEAFERMKAQLRVERAPSAAASTPARAPGTTSATTSAPTSASASAATTAVSARCVRRRHVAERRWPDRAGAPLRPLQARRGGPPVRRLARRGRQRSGGARQPRRATAVRSDDRIGHAVAGGAHPAADRIHGQRNSPAGHRAGRVDTRRGPRRRPQGAGPGPPGGGRAGGGAGGRTARLALARRPRPRRPRERGGTDRDRRCGSRVPGRHRGQRRAPHRDRRCGDGRLWRAVHRGQPHGHRGAGATAASPVALARRCGRCATGTDRNQSAGRGRATKPSSAGGSRHSTSAMRRSPSTRTPAVPSSPASIDSAPRSRSWTTAAPRPVRSRSSPEGPIPADSTSSSAISTPVWSTRRMSSPEPSTRTTSGAASRSTYTRWGPFCQYQRPSASAW